MVNIAAIRHVKNKPPTNIATARFSAAFIYMAIAGMFIYMAIAGMFFYMANGYHFIYNPGFVHEISFPS